MSLLTGTVTTGFSLDPSFNNGCSEIITNGFEDTNTTFSGNSIVGSDGKITVGGAIQTGATESSAIIARWNSDGTLDPTFGSSGGYTIVVPTGSNLIGIDMVELDDGSYLLYGSNGGLGDLFLLKFDSNGIPDPTFGTGGVLFFNNGNQNLVQLGTNNAIVKQSDGKVLFLFTELDGADFFATVGRLNADASPDTGYGTGGYLRMVTAAFGVSFARSLEIDSSDNIYVPGNGALNNASNGFGIVFKATSAGVLDPTFGTDGAASSTIALTTLNCLVLLEDGSIVSFGYFDTGFRFEGFSIKFSSTGVIDSGYGEIVYSNQRSFNTSVLVNNNAIITSSSNSMVYINLLNGSIDYLEGSFNTIPLDFGPLKPTLASDGSLFYGNFFKDNSPAEIFICKFKAVKQVRGEQIISNCPGSIKAITALDFSRTESLLIKSFNDSGANPNPNCINVFEVSSTSFPVGSKLYQNGAIYRYCYIDSGINRGELVSINDSFNFNSTITAITTGSTSNGSFTFLNNSGDDIEENDPRWVGGTVLVRHGNDTGVAPVYTISSITASTSGSSVTVTFNMGFIEFPVSGTIVGLDVRVSTNKYYCQESTSASIPIGIAVRLTGTGFIWVQVSGPISIFHNTTTAMTYGDLLTLAGADGQVDPVTGFGQVIVGQALEDFPTSDFNGLIDVQLEK